MIWSVSMFGSGSGAAMEVRVLMGRMMILGGSERAKALTQSSQRKALSFAK
jgi:hypothetical protein